MSRGETDLNQLMFIPPHPNPGQQPRAYGSLGLAGQMNRETRLCSAA